MGGKCGDALVERKWRVVRRIRWNRPRADDIRNTKNPQISLWMILLALDEST